MKNHNWGGPVITNRPVIRMTADTNVGSALLVALEAKGITPKSARGVAEAINQKEVAA